MKKGYLITLIVLAVLTLLSLALNGVIILGLLRAQQIALDAVGDTRAIVTGIGDDTFSYTIEVDQKIPIAISVPIYEEVAVPINTTIPVDTIVVIPINLGVITYDLEIPINTIIPVDLNVVAPISQTIDIVTTVPLNVKVPIEIPFADTPLTGYMEELDAALAQMETRLEQMEMPLKHLFGGED